MGGLGTEKDYFEDKRTEDLSAPEDDDAKWLTLKIGLAIRLKKYLDSRRIIWNSLRNITIKDFEVEVYVQDTEEPHFASGVYSVMYDEWIVEPKQEEVILDSHKILSKSKQWMDIIDNIETKVDTKEIDDSMGDIQRFKDKLKKLTPENEASNN